MRPILYPSSLYDRRHLPPSSHTTPRPETFSTGSTLLLTDAMDHIQSIEEVWRNGHLSEHATFSLFQTFEDDDLCGKTDAFGRQGQRFRYSATGVKNHAAKGSYLTRRSSSRLQERLPILICEVKPFTLLIE